MKPQKKSIRDFFSPVSRTPPPAASPQTTLPQRNANNAPTRQSNPPTSSGVAQDANPHAVHTPLSSSNTPVSSAPSTMRAASADAPPFNPSQTSANSGASKRTTSNGQQVVLDSDDDSLPDLDFGLPTPKVKTIVTTTTTRSKRMSEDQENGLQKPVKKAKDNKSKFDVLVKAAHKNLETERQIKEHSALLDQSLEEYADTTLALNEELLGQAVDDDDDPEKAHRLLQAMQRTNATQMESVYHFFQDDSDSIQAQPKFPLSSLPKHGWASIFKDSHARDQAFMTGFAQQIFRMQQLPEELASWMIECISQSRNETLSCRYIEILESEPHNKHLRTLLDNDRLDSLFGAMGANTTQLKAQSELVPISVPRTETKVLLPPSLVSTTRLLQQAAPVLRSKARRRALSILCHVCLDDRVIADAHILHIIQDAMEALICNLDNHKMTSTLSDIISQLLVKVTHPLLQRNLVCSFPATSPLTAYLQRHLALALLVYPVPVDVELSDPKLPDMIHQYLDKSSNFRIDKDTDYEHLTARLTLLDIAIGPGLLNVPYQPLSSPTTSETGSSPVRAPVPASSEVKDFNNEVDALARQFQLLSNSIVEAGAAVDLTIMDAKDSIERLRARLEHAVRIGGKKVYNVFGDEDEQAQPNLRRFFKSTSKDAPKKSIFDEEDDVAVSLADDSKA